MTTIDALQKKLTAFDHTARSSIHKKDPEGALKDAWHRLFSIELNSTSAKSFAKYYREMNSKKTTRRNKLSGGGLLSPATLDYSMTPGSSVAVYGRFPTEMGSDPEVITNLDVYYQNSLSAGCGTENSSLQVPEGMGSNKVGGKRTRKNTRKTYRKKNTAMRKKSMVMRKKSARKTMKRSSRKYRGGNLAESLLTHPYIASAPPNLIQSTMNQVLGGTEPVPFPSHPTDHAWALGARDTSGLINPGIVTTIDSTFPKMATEAPWSSTI